ncbi:MAG: hypothetical protein JXR58_03595 [Bacteroidales bacterium]|nr:hypothetical protein [Bacteroidales bacterium]
MRIKLLLAVAAVLSLNFLIAQNTGVGNVNFTPQSPLHIYYNANGNLLQLTNNTTTNAANRGLILGATGANFSMNNREAGYIGIFTGNTERFRIPNANQVHALSLGTNLLPFYSFSADPNTGIYSSGADALDFSTGGTARLRIPNANQIHGLSLGSAALPFYSFSADANTGMFSSGADVLNFSTGGLEKIRISSNGLSLINGDYVNFSTTLGTTGYGFRDNAGTMEYKHSGGTWSVFPVAPSIPGGVEYWIRPVASNYIRPEYNDAVRIYDDGETYGYYYNGSTNLVAGYFRTTNATNGACAVQGFSDVAGNQTYGYLGYNASITVGATTIGGAAVHGRVEDADRTSVYAKTSGNSDIAALLSYSDVWIPAFCYGDHNNALMAARPAVYGQMNVNVNVGGIQPALQAVHDRSGGSGNSGYSVGLYAFAEGADQDVFGVMGIASGNFVNSKGGYFDATSSWGNRYAYVADEFNGRKILGTGSVSEIIPTANHGRITLTCPESPEYWYIDYGSTKLINGKAHVELDPILSDIIIVDENNPIKVFIQDNILTSNGIVVVNKSATGFDLIEKNGGTSNGEIDYTIVAKPKTNYGEGRFPQAPGPGWLKPDKEPATAKAKNQRNKDNIWSWPADWEVYGYDPEEFTEIGGIIPAGPNKGKTKLGNGKYGNGVQLNSSNYNKSNNISQ